MNNLGFHCQRISHIETGILGNDLHRGEFYNFRVEDLPALRKAIDSHRLEASIHTPLVAPDWYPRPPTWTFLCDVDRDRRELTLRLVRETLEIAAEYRAQYVVAHFPCPNTDATGESRSRLESIAWGSAERLAELSLKHNMPVHIEGFGPSPFLAAEFLSQVLTRFTPLRYCFDTGHMNLASERDGIDFYEFARAMSPHVGSVHLWNNRGMDDYRAYGHIPVHPAQKPEDGWVDVEKAIRILAGKKLSVPVIFENAHRYPVELGNYDYRDGVQWVKELVATLS